MKKKPAPLDDLYLFQIGEAQQAYLQFGCHYDAKRQMFRFRVWAPNAKKVSIVGDFNDWNENKHPMQEKNGIWTGYVDQAKKGDHYKYCIWQADQQKVLKADPFAFFAELRPKTASKIWPLFTEEYHWQDAAYLQRRKKRNVFAAPMSIYEMHLNSWRKKGESQFVGFCQIAEELAQYLLKMHYTHVELMPIMEHPYDGSWGYQVTGYYAVSARYGTPEDLMYFVDVMHRHNIGVILDWVPAHFPKDEHGLAKFDGTCLYEYEDPRIAEHPEWGTLVFNYRRTEVKSFLISNAVFWMDCFHIDGLRFDAVSSMLYLDYGRSQEASIKNQYGGNYNLEAIDFLKKVNTTVLSLFPGAITIAEEATAFPLVTKPPYDQGLGFSFKWNMGYMNDTLQYFASDPLFRKGQHHLLTFPMMYADTENFILPYSHDEVVHGKHSMIEKMPGNYEEKFANLRALYALMFAYPGKKLMFMGNEFAQFIEWDETKQLDWFLLQYPMHQAMQDFVQTLNACYQAHPSFYQLDASWDGFSWLSVDDCETSVLSFLRKSVDQSEQIMAIFNFTPVQRDAYEILFSQPGELKLLLNSDATQYGGWGNAVFSHLKAKKMQGKNGLSYSAKFKLPPLGAMYYQFIPGNDE